MTSPSDDAGNTVAKNAYLVRRHLNLPRPVMSISIVSTLRSQALVR